MASPRYVILLVQEGIFLSRDDDVGSKNNCGGDVGVEKMLKECVDAQVGRWTAPPLSTKGRCGLV
jgi:hypothetical protein